MDRFFQTFIQSSSYQIYWKIQMLSSYGSKRTAEKVWEIFCSTLLVVEVFYDFTGSKDVRDADGKCSSYCLLSSFCGHNIVFSISSSCR